MKKSKQKHQTGYQKLVYQTSEGDATDKNTRKKFYEYIQGR